MEKSNHLAELCGQIFFDGRFVKFPAQYYLILHTGYVITSLNPVE